MRFVRTMCYIQSINHDYFIFLLSLEYQWSDWQVMSKWIWHKTWQAWNIRQYLCSSSIAKVILPQTGSGEYGKPKVIVVVVIIIIMHYPSLPSPAILMMLCTSSDGRLIVFWSGWSLLSSGTSQTQITERGGNYYGKKLKEKGTA